MDDVLRQRLWRHLEALPDAQLYQVLDYIEFLSSKYARSPVRDSASSVQKFGERLQDRLRVQRVGVRAMRGTMDAVGTADRVFSGLAQAGRSLLREVEEGFQEGPTHPNPSAPRSLPPGTGERRDEKRDTPVD